MSDGPLPEKRYTDKKSHKFFSIRNSEQGKKPQVYKLTKKDSNKVVGISTKKKC
jgi:hypothetical protein